MTKGVVSGAEGAVKSWADQVEFDDGGALGGDGLPPREETYDEKTQLRTVVEYSLNDRGKKVKIIKTYKVNKMPKTVAMRMKLKKFGDSANDPTGPNPANTRVEEECSINYNISDLGADEDEETRNKLKGKMVTCRICKGDHWSTKCPYKDTLAPLQESLGNVPKREEPAEASAQSAAGAGGKYIPPNMRDGGNKRGESMNYKGKDDSASLRVTNLSEDTRECDVQELFRPFGSISRIFLAKDKVTGQSKGYAFVSYHNREDAAKAIQGLHGYGYDHLILQVDWSRPNPK